MVRSKYIPFNKVLKNPDSWDDLMDLDCMTDNYLKLKPIINKMCFREYPKHPNLFTVLFSKPDFGDHLIRNLVNSGITELGFVFFNEYSEEDREILISKGLLELIPCRLGIYAVVFIREGENYSVNVIA